MFHVKHPRGHVRRFSSQALRLQAVASRCALAPEQEGFHAQDRIITEIDCHTTIEYLDSRHYAVSEGHPQNGRVLSGRVEGGIVMSKDGTGITRRGFVAGGGQPLFA